MVMLQRLIPACLLLVLTAAQLHPQSASARQSYRIGGTVVDGLTGQRLANTEVAVGLSQQPEVIASVVTGSEGHFLLDGLAPGKYWLMAHRAGFTQQGLDEHEGFFTGIVVGPDLDSEHVLFRLRPDAVISGTVTDEAGDPVRGAEVLLFRTGVQDGRQITNQRGRRQTDDQGHYKFGHLRPGAFYIAVSATPWYAQPAQQGGAEGNDQAGSLEEQRATSLLDAAYPITYYPGVTDSDSAVPVVVKAGDRGTADVSLTAVPALHLRIGQPGSDSAAGDVRLMAHVLGDAMVPVSAQATSTDGVLEVDGVAPGQYLLSVQTYGEEHAQPSAPVEEIQVSANANITISDQSALTPVTGKVILDEGEKLPSPVFLRMVNFVGGRSAGTRVSANGDFQLNVAPGKYEVAVLNVPKAIVSSLSAAGGKVIGGSVEVDAGRPLQLAVNLTRAVGSIEGIAMRDGKPTPGAMIVLVPQDVENHHTYFRRDQSDSDGTFTLRSVLPGRYIVVAIQDGWDLEWQTPAVLHSYVKQGTEIEVGPNRKSTVKVKVQ
jgi:Carboxypeptidase regulatory-like domain